MGKARVDQAMHVQHHAVIRTANNAHYRDSLFDGNGLGGRNVPDVFHLGGIVVVCIRVSVALAPSVSQAAAVDIPPRPEARGLPQKEGVAVAAGDFLGSC